MQGLDPCVLPESAVFIAKSLHHARVVLRQAFCSCRKKEGASEKRGWSSHEASCMSKNVFDTTSHRCQSLFIQQSTPSESVMPLHLYSGFYLAKRSWFHCLRYEELGVQFLGLPCLARLISWQGSQAVIAVQILYCAEQQEFTMLFHLDTPSFALTSVGIAKSGERMRHIAASSNSPVLFRKHLLDEEQTTGQLSQWRNTNPALLQLPFQRWHLSLKRQTSQNNSL